MLKEKSVFQTRTFSVLMVATVAALAMVAIFFLTRVLTTAEPVGLNMEAPSIMKAVAPQVVAGVVPSDEGQRRTRLAKAYMAAFGSTTRLQQAEIARWNGLAGQQIAMGGSTSRVQQAEIARWNGLAGQQANLSGGMSRAQLAEIARWNGLAGQAQVSTSP